MTDSVALRRKLAEELVAGGHIRTPGWRAAVAAIPRDEFVADFFTAADPHDGSPTLYTSSSRLSTDDRLTLTYSDETLVTQLDGQLSPSDVDGPVPGSPTSSSTMPSLVTRMWEELDVRDGDRVLEIGTGTGYSTALGCHRLGDELLTSIEFDPAVAARAASSLERVGRHPHLVIGDGLAGYAERAVRPNHRDLRTAECPACVDRAMPGRRAHLGDAVRLARRDRAGQTHRHRSRYGRGHLHRS